MVERRTPTGGVDNHEIVGHGGGGRGIPMERGTLWDETRRCRREKDAKTFASFGWSNLDGLPKLKSPSSSASRSR